MTGIKEFVLLVLLLNFASCARILGIFHVASYSHFIIGETLFKELARKGHDVVMISPFPQKTPIKNYSDIYLSEIKAIFDKEKEKGQLFFEAGNLTPLGKLTMMIEVCYGFTEAVFKNKEVQALINNSEIQFDLIIMENFFNDAFFGFGHRFKAPTFIVNAGGAARWDNKLTGNPSPTSYIVDKFLPYKPNMTFFQRLHNTFTAITEDIAMHMYGIPPQNELMHTYFPEAPHIYSLLYNTSFMLLNSYPGFSAPDPLMPNMKEVGGIHINNKTMLSDDVKKFLDGSEEGVILFALGSNLNSKDLPPAKLQAILTAFKKWNKPVLWKFEDEDLPGKSDNIKILKWIPQSAILAHPNVKAFITHGGRLSTIESIYFGVPIIGIPIFAEQPSNIAQAVQAGYSLMVDFENLNAEDLYNAMIEITENPKYHEKAKLLSKAMHMQNALEESVHWVEYVIEFDGAPHLRSFGVNLPFYKYMLIDVILFVVVMAFSAIALGTYLIFLICCSSKTKRKEKIK